MVFFAYVAFELHYGFCWYFETLNIVLAID